MLNVTFKPFMLSDGMLNTVLLSVAAPFKEQKKYKFYKPTNSA
jgi:hypothetical protein